MHMMYSHIRRHMCLVTHFLMTAKIKHKNRGKDSHIKKPQTQPVKKNKTHETAALKTTQYSNNLFFFFF